MQLTKEYFDQQFKKLATKDDLKVVKQYLDDQITGVLAFLTDKATHKDDLIPLATTAQMNKRFGEVDTQLVLLENDTILLKGQLHSLSKRTTEDDNAFSKELMKLKHRMDQIEKQVRKYKHQT